ncbi:MAG: tetratricopeptide repeat protein, partial [Patescibacteria group bacterium]|nr:tetratricopeptide repeat protein [Patescibacteria group bacterium]
LVFGYFFHQSNLSLEFLFFLLMAGFIALVSSTRKETILKSSSLTTLATTFIFTLIFIFGLGIFIMEGQRYIADANYLKGVRSWQNQESENSVRFIEKAVSINPKIDLYWRELSQIYIQRINEVAQRTDLTKEQISQQVQTLINNSIISAKTATDINPNNVANWSVRGYIYQNMIGIIDGAEDWTKTSYKTALKLEPNNPYFSTQTGIALLGRSSFFTEEEKAEKEKVVNEAIDEFKKAIELKSDYAPARFQLAMAYQSQGKQAEAIEELETTKSIAPDDVGLSFQLGLIYYQNKDYAKAKNELERTIVLNPDYSNALYFLGLTYDKLDQSSMAIEKFRKVAELNPDNSEVQTILENLRNGRGALENILEEEPPKIPIDEELPEELQPEEE